MTVACPEVEELQHLLRGDMAPELSDAGFRHVEQCATCADEVEGLLAADPLVAAVRGQPPAAPPAAPVIDLIRRLSALRASAKTASEGATLGPRGEADDDLAEVLAPPQAPDELGRLGGYRVLKKLGAGGMGVVYLAEDVALRRQVALKVMLPTLAHRPSARKRFLREARAVAAVEHENIVAIHQVGEERGVPYLAMPLLRGTSLEERLREGGALPVADVLRLGKQIALGLSAAHERGLVHRDVKPGNIWIEPDSGGGRAKLLDFGLAREQTPGRAAGDEEPLTDLGTIIGTPAYLAPEQARGLPVDGRADLFSLGCVLYRMSTGQPPFAGDDPLATLLSLATQDPAPPSSVDPSIPRGLSDLVMRLLAKDPKKRPASAAEVARQLAALEGAATGTAPRRRWTWRTAVVAALLLAAVGTVAAEIIVRIKDRNGKTVAEMKVPEGGSVETVEGGGTPADADAPAAPPTLMEFGGKVGEKYTFRVAGTTLGTVWGTGPYTLDSSLGAAAVHAGAVKAGQIGLVTVEIVAPPASFGGSAANGVTTLSYGAFPAGAFTITRGGGGKLRPPDEGKDAAPRTLADPGQVFIERWPEGSVLSCRVVGTTTGIVWGSGPYTVDSTLAAAAVHAGILKDGETGIVTVRIIASPDSYRGSTANGVTTQDYGAWPPGAFTFVKRVAPPVDIDKENGKRGDPGSLSGYAGRQGKRYTFEVIGKRKGIVYGSGPYTLDSSLATAAVHAGILKEGQTGTVTVEIMASPDSYAGTTENGVTSIAYGVWPPGAFKFIK